ncbi:hypothetical protein RP20_CCG013229 [Aedes albopictus]|nr:hypothetical protein RP20_CCG013229 [Aedes albopictus]
MASNPMKAERIALIAVIVVASLLSAVHNDPVRRFQKVTKIEEDESTTKNQDLESSVEESSTPVSDFTRSEAHSNATDNEADSVGISTVMVKLKHFGTKNFTFLEPDHIPISDFMGLDENVDLELLFSEQMGADHKDSGNPVENVVLQIEDYDDEGNSQSYFLHSSPYSESFFRDVLQRLGVYKYIMDYQEDQQREPKVPYRVHSHYIDTPSGGIRNLPNHFVDQVTPSSGSSTKKPPKPHKAHGGGLFNQFKQRIKAIYPGTVWCGDGNQAKSENDIGFFYQTDVCCRAHDLCPTAISAGEQFNRLKNNGYFTRSHCDCDKQFYNCLKNANTLVSNQIGYTYFNLLKPQCFRHEHPKVACSKKVKGKCLSYVVDETQDKLWQWFDNLTY